VHPSLAAARVAHAEGRAARVGRPCAEWKRTPGRPRREAQSRPLKSAPRVNSKGKRWLVWVYIVRV